MNIFFFAEIFTQAFWGALAICGHENSPTSITRRLQEFQYYYHRSQSIGRVALALPDHGSADGSTWMIHHWKYPNDSCKPLSANLPTYPSTTVIATHRAKLFLTTGNPIESSQIMDRLISGSLSLKNPTVHDSQLSAIIEHH